MAKNKFRCLVKDCNACKSFGWVDFCGEQKGKKVFGRVHLCEEHFNKATEYSALLHKKLRQEKGDNYFICAVNVEEYFHYLNTGKLREKVQ